MHRDLRSRTLKGLVALESPLPAPLLSDETAQPQGWGQRPNPKPVPHLPCNGTKKPLRRPRAGTACRWLLSQGSHCLSWELKRGIVGPGCWGGVRTRDSLLPTAGACLPGPEQLVEGGSPTPPAALGVGGERGVKPPSNCHPYPTALLAHTHSTNIC